jgi:hypothetical protein
MKSALEGSESIKPEQLGRETGQRGVRISFVRAVNAQQLGKCSLREIAALAVNLRSDGGRPGINFPVLRYTCKVIGS